MGRTGNALLGMGSHDIRIVRDALHGGDAAGWAEVGGHADLAALPALNLIKPIGIHICKT